MEWSEWARAAEFGARGRGEHAVGVTLILNPGQFFWLFSSYCSVPTVPLRFAINNSARSFLRRLTT